MSWLASTVRGLNVWRRILWAKWVDKALERRRGGDFDCAEAAAANEHEPGLQFACCLLRKMPLASFREGSRAMPSRSCRGNTARRRKNQQQHGVARSVLNTPLLNAPP